ncbi:hypothetical protein [Promicromonospora sp. NFX87]|uniref:hypothetical protein n=1 Tax=Promicromonospora sp. NFX87 TaxID=3402691 RepID=UPI003AFA2D94
MARYCVNRNAQPGTNDHEVHNLDNNCIRLPSAANQIYLGAFASCVGAVASAKGRVGNDVNGCYYCASECNSG